MKGRLAEQVVHIFDVRFEKDIQLNHGDTQLDHREAVAAVGSS